jgi:sensor domain CHASE-containing protein
MKLKNKIMIAVGLTFICSAVVLYTVTRSIVLGSFNKLEEKIVRTNVSRVLSSLNDELNTIRSIGGDWAPWDETRDFVLNGNRKYIEENLMDSTLVNLKLNFMIFINSSGKIVHVKGVDLVEEADKPVHRALIDHITSHGFLLKHANPSDNKTGFILLPEEPVLISSWPISRNDWRGPVQGVLIIGRYFGEREVKNLSEKIRLPVRFVMADSLSVPVDFEKAGRFLSKDLPVYVQKLSPESIAGYSEFKDIYGNPCFTLRVDSPRDIFKQGKESTHYFLLVLLFVGAAVLVVLLLVIQLVVLRPLAKLTENALSVGISGDLSRRFTTRRSDEIGKLAREFDNMLEQLMKSNNDLKGEISERIQAEEEAIRLH